jgi:hypothetical protein
MRNIIFHIISEQMFDHYTTMDESDFYEHLESLNADSVQNQDPVDAKDSVERLVSRLQNAGLKVETATGPESEEFYVFQTGNAEETKTCKCQYFAAAFAKLQEMVGQMSLETFLSDGTEEYQLRMLIKNTSGDMVYYGDWMESSLSLDSFIRKLTPNSVYYIAPETVYVR